MSVYTSKCIAVVGGASQYANSTNKKGKTVVDDKIKIKRMLAEIAFLAILRNQYDSAECILEFIRSYRDNSFIPDLGQAYMATRDDDYDKAAGLMRKHLQSDKYSGLANAYSALFYMLAKDYKHALSHAEAASESDDQQARDLASALMSEIQQYEDNNSGYRAYCTH